MSREYEELQERKRKWIPIACEGKCSIKEAAKQIGVTERTVSVLKRRYRLYGDAVFINGHKGKNSQKKKYNDATRAEICKIYREDYQGVSFKSFRDCLENNHGIKISAVLLIKILNDAGIFSQKQYDSKYIKLEKERIFELENAFKDFSDFVCTVGESEDGTEYIGINNNGLSDASMSFLRKMYCQKLAYFSKENFIRTKRDTKLNLDSVKYVLEEIYVFLKRHKEFTNYGRAIEVCVSEVLNQYHFGTLLNFQDKNISCYKGIQRDIKALLISLGELSEKKHGGKI